VKNEIFTIIVIAFNISFIRTDEEVYIPAPDVSMSNEGGKVVQIAPNRVGVIDTGFGSGWEQLVVFEYNPDTKKFEIVSSLPYEDILNHPKENGIPVREDKYGN
jgi:hypothetical protein